jgi:ribonuclease T2
MSPILSLACIILLLSCACAQYVPNAMKRMENDMSNLSTELDFRLDSDSCPSTPFNNSDFLLLVQSNQVTFCGSKGDKCFKDVVEKLFDNDIFFTIHGLWPQLQESIQKHNWPQCCSSDPFNEGGLGALKDIMASKSWVKATSFTLWEHEWSKHGTCALYAAPTIPYINTQFDYFKYANQLYFDSDVSNLLLKAGIIPDDNNPVRASHIFDQFRSQFGVTPIISYYTVNNVKLISEVWMCVDKENPQFIQCPSTLHTNDQVSESDQLIIPTKHILH